MHEPALGDHVRLDLYCKDPDSKQGEDCATFYRTSRGTWIVQGDRREEPAVVAQLHALKDCETAVEIPEPLVELLVMRYLRERHGIDLG